MTADQFAELLERRISLMRSTLVNKAREYAIGEDCLHNFKASTIFSDQEPVTNCWMFLVKHLTSLRDIVNKNEDFGILPKRDVIDEKIGDAINYLVLLEALLIENQ